MERSIGDILGSEQPSEVNETPVTEPSPEAATAEPAAEEPKGPVRDDKGRFAPKETGVEEAPAQAPEQPAPPAEPTNQLPKEEYSALRAVRDENKELKRQIDAIQRQIYAQPQPQPPPPADFWDDPHGFMNSFGNQLMQQWEQRETSKRLDASESAARGRYQDYDDAFQAFEQSVQANPHLAVQLAQADDPGEFAYRKGKMALEIQQAGSMDDLRAKIRAEIEAEAKAAFQPAKLPSTTAGDTSIGARSGPEWAGPRPIGEILRS